MPTGGGQSSTIDVTDQNNIDIVVETTTENTTTSRTYIANSVGFERRNFLKYAHNDNVGDRVVVTETKFSETVTTRTNEFDNYGNLVGTSTSQTVTNYYTKTNVTILDGASEVGGYNRFSGSVDPVTVDQSEIVLSEGLQEFNDWSVGFRESSNGLSINSIDTNTEVRERQELAANRLGYPGKGMSIGSLALAIGKSTRSFGLPGVVIGLMGSAGGVAMNRGAEMAPDNSVKTGTRVWGKML